MTLIEGKTNNTMRAVQQHLPQGRRIKTNWILAHG